MSRAYRRTWQPPILAGPVVDQCPSMLKSFLHNPLADIMAKVLVCVAWPYANAPIHLGHVAGSLLPPDIFSKYHRMIGNEVLMVSGSDQHGTPITVKADKEGVTPETIAERYHEINKKAIEGLGIEFSLFTKTHTSNHINVVDDVFLTLKDKGHLYKKGTQQYYCPECEKFLPDRYVEGKCPYCGNEKARGDQCERCGKTFEGGELVEAACLHCSTAPQMRETEHYFLRLSEFQQPLIDWVSGKDNWKSSVKLFTKNWLEAGLQDRPITRDMSWGVPVPLPGWEGKVIYVWFEAVIGYLSASKEWASTIGRPDEWRSYWQDPEVRSFYFLGKDNIPFHTIIWPGMLIGYNAGETRLNLPYDVPANEYLNLGGEQFSTSRGRVIGFNTVLREFESEAWRYVLTALAPETSDVEFTWREFMERVNNELVANWGNLVNRVLGFAYKRFEGRIPAPGALDETDIALLAEIRSGFESAGDLYNAVKLKAALTEVRRLSQRVNQYLNEKAPWQRIKTDPTAAATTVYVALQAIDWLKVLWAPILPQSSERIHSMLGYDTMLFGRQYTERVADGRGTHLVLRYDHGQAAGRWQADELPAGQALREPSALFTKLDDEVMADKLQAVY